MPRVLAKKGFAVLPVLIFITTLAAIAAGIAGYFGIIDRKSTDSPGGVACTEEAMRCLDGSYVGRTGLNCEFAECLGVDSDYYDQLANKCESGDRCCLSSVENWMRLDGGYRLAENGVCEIGYVIRTLGCSTAYKWCEPDPTYFSDLQTYRNEEYGFEVGYPAKWRVSTILKENITSEFPPPDLIVQFFAYGAIFDISIFDAQLNENVFKATTRILGYEPSPVTYSYITVAGKEAVYFEDDNYNSHEAFLIHGGRLYILSGGGGSFVPEAFSRIISTFRFTGS